MIIYLIGFMGCGKTTIGKLLAKTLGYNFTDTDTMIEEAEKQEISSIFETKGSHFFRNLESEILNTTQNMTNTVIATGGGLPCNTPNITFLRSHGLVIYLNASPKILYLRLYEKRLNRPLIKDIPEENLQSFIAHTLEERKIYYEQAHIHYTVLTPYIKTKQVVKDLESLIAEWKK